MYQRDLRDSLFETVLREKSLLPNKLKQDTALETQAALHPHDITKQNGYFGR